MSTLKNKVIEQINNLTESELVTLNNIYASECNMYDNEVYSNDEEFFDTFFSGKGSGLKVAQATFYGDYNYSHDWVTFNGYGNLQSIAIFRADNLCELVEVISEYIIENPEPFSYVIDINELQEEE